MIDSKEPGRQVSSSSAILGYSEASAPQGWHISIVSLAKEAHVSNHSKIHTETVSIAGSLLVCWPYVSASVPAGQDTPLFCTVTALFFKETSLVAMAILLMSMSTLLLDVVISSMYTTTLFLFREALVVYMFTLLQGHTVALHGHTFGLQGDTLFYQEILLFPMPIPSLLMVTPLYCMSTHFSKWWHYLY